MKRRILFVDDEPNILQALARMLRPMRQHWEMVFEEDSLRALTLIEQNDFDVVVSDFRMPKMDGVTLFKKVREGSPKTVRLLLSGQAERKSLLHSVGPAHQFLAKPCEPEKLKESVMRCCQVNDVIFGQTIKALVSRIEKLPVLPTLYKKLVDELEHPEPSLQTIGEVIESDVTMSARILNVVNSAFFGLPRTITSPSHAATYLGVDVLKDLVLVLKLFEEFEAENSMLINVSQLCQHSFKVAGLAKQIMKSENDSEDEANMAFTAGMLHDIGELILAQQMADQFKVIIEKEQAGQSSIYDLEKEAFEISHAELGAYLLGIWGLPLPLVETVMFHHEPSRSSIREFPCRIGCLSSWDMGVAPPSC